eukprot:scaffold363_cov216-Skeletonema_marinoi.AAC.8
MPMSNHRWLPLEALLVWRMPLNRCILPRLSVVEDSKHMLVMQERQQQHALANTPMCVTSEVCMYVGAVYCILLSTVAIIVVKLRVRTIDQLSTNYRPRHCQLSTNYRRSILVAIDQVSTNYRP